MIKATGGLLKLLVSAVIGGGVSTVVTNIVTATTPQITTKVQKTLIKIGSYSLGLYLGDVVAEHITDRVFNTTVSVNVEIKEKDTKEGKK